MRDRYVMAVSFILLFALFACRDFGVTVQPPQFRLAIEQGVWGRVLFWEGDFMPTPDPDNSRGTITGVSRLVQFHEPTRRSDATPVDDISRGPFYRSVGKPLVANIVSNDSGYFQMGLEPGVYSIFVREEELWYANLDDGTYLQPVRVFPDSVTRFDIDITYIATF